MKYPNLNEEKKLWQKGYKIVAGLDEAGRGPLAGPVVAAAVVIDKKFTPLNTAKRQFARSELFNGVKDSKKLSPKNRQKFYKILTKNPNIEWGTGVVSEKVIDKINILEATKLAMKKAIKKLKMKNVNSKIDFLILDGKMKIDLPVSQKSIVKADEKVFSCAAASIIAKVTRDKIMEKYHKKYPQYSFNGHKGYPTRLHRKMLKEFGPCSIHRKSFHPVRKYVLSNGVLPRRKLKTK